MSSGIPSIAFAIDISKSMDEQYGYIGKKFEIAKQILFNLPEIIFRIKGSYRSHLYVFPSLIPDVIPCEKIYQITVIDSYSLELLKKSIDYIVGTRPTTPLIESLAYIANDIEKKGLIVAITDGLYIRTLNEKVEELRKRLEENDVNIVILCLNTQPQDLARILQKLNRIEVEVLYPSQLHQLLLRNTLEYVVYTKILPKLM